METDPRGAAASPSSSSSVPRATGSPRAEPLVAPASDPLPGGGRTIELDARFYLNLLLHYRWLLVFFLLIFLALGVFQLRRTTPQYSASASLMYEPTRTRVLTSDLQIGSRPYYFRIDEMLTAVEMIRSPRIAQAVIDALGMGGGDEETPDPPSSGDNSPLDQLKNAWERFVVAVRSNLIDLPPLGADRAVLREQGQVRNLLRRVAVRQRQATKLIEITATDRNPAQAARIANEFATQFIHSVLEEQREAYGYARNYLNEQIEKTKGALETAERELFDYNAQSDLKAMDETLQVAIETMIGLTKQLEETKNQIAEHEAQAEAADSRTVRRLMIEQDPYYIALVRKLGDLQVQRITLAAENEPDFPDLLRLDREIEGIEDRLTSATALVRQDFLAKLNLVQIRERHIAERLEQQKQRVHAIEEDMIRYRMLKRQVDSTREIFEGLLDQFKRLDVADGLSMRDVQLVGSANIPTTPSRPHITSTLVKFLLAGLFLGVSFVFALSWLDRSVKNPMLIEDRLRLPTLGLVPYLFPQHRWTGWLRRRKAKVLPRIGRDEDRRALGREAFRYLRTSLQYSTAEHPPRVVLVTSCQPEDGKSTVCVNLGISLAEREKPVLLIDADLRKPVLHKAFRHARMPGLSDVLTGQKSVEETIVPTDVPHLDLLPAGPTVPSPIDLIDSQAMNDLLRDLKTRYDVILLDSAPCDAVADSLILSQKVDGVCLVVRVGRTLNEVLDTSVGRLRSMGARIFGVAYNRAEPRTTPGEYGERYGYDYGYGYGQSETPAPAPAPALARSRTPKDK